MEVRTQPFVNNFAPEVGRQQTSVKDVFVKFTIPPLLSRSRAKSVSPEMWGIKRPEATVATFALGPRGSEKKRYNSWHELSESKTRNLLRGHFRDHQLGRADGGRRDVPVYDFADVLGPT